MSEKHQRIVDEIINKYKQDSSVKVIALFGSMARGEVRENSDVDIEVISDSAQEWQLLKQKKYGIDIDLVICPISHLLHQLENYPYLCYDYMSEKVVYDPQGIMKGIKEKLRDYFGKHPEVVRFWEDKLRIMRENKAKGQDPKDAIKNYDEAEILFSEEHRVTRDFFRE